MNELIKIQTELKAPKRQFNKFGNYAYRSAEDITEALKPLLLKYNCQLTTSDEVILIGERYYVKSTATIINADGKTQTSSAIAREEAQKKGMDSSQITGSTASYARKYALSGLFLLDDNHDADSEDIIEIIIRNIERITSRDKLTSYYNSLDKSHQNDERIVSALQAHAHKIDKS